jgi:hypothetical protein
MLNSKPKSSSKDTSFKTGKAYIAGRPAILNEFVALINPMLARSNALQNDLQNQLAAEISQHE